MREPIDLSGFPAAETLYARIGGHEGIARLLHHFYADVRQHHLLGPVFNSRIRNWPAHLAKIGEFWARQTGGPSSYSGGFGAAHLALGISAEHFKHWLTLWDWNCRRQLPPAEARELSALAHKLGARLSAVVEGRSALTVQPANRSSRE